MLAVTAALSAFIGIIVGYLIAPKLNNARLFHEYCRGKLSERNHREDELQSLQRKVLRLEALTRKID